MKKTLIALMAMASCAMGLTLTDAIATSNGTAITLNPASSAATAVVVVDITTLQSVMAKDAALTKRTIINFDGNNDIGIQTNYSSYDHDSNAETPALISTSGLYGCWNGGSAYGVGMGTGFQDANFWEGGAAAAITLTYEYDKGTSGTFTLLDAQGNVLQSVGGEYNTSLRGTGLNVGTVAFDADIVTSAYVFNQVVTADVAMALGKEAATVALIPEPATATLSLLALAGLAARRRRK